MMHTLFHDMNDIEQITDRIKRSTDYQINKRILYEKTQTDLHIAHAGGLFKISPEMIAFVAMWPIDELFLMDSYQNPILIDKQIFLVIAQQHYHRVMNTWHEQHAQLKNTRKI
jgi:hypothetical protein